MSKKDLVSRRRFLIQSLSAVGLTAIYPYRRILADVLASSPNPAKRRHLINFVDVGGWDAFWMHNFFDPSLNSISCIPDLYQGTVKGVRNSDKDFVMFDGQKMSFGMKFFTPTDLSRMSILNGILAVGGHDLGTELLAKGAGTPYAASWSSLISQSMADNDYIRPLHYCKLGDRTNFKTGILNGHAIPNQIYSQTAWKNLTNGSAVVTDPANDTAAIENLLQELSATVPQQVFKKKDSWSLFSAFNQQEKGAAAVVGSQMATQSGKPDAFIDIWIRYFKAIQLEAQNQATSGFGAVSDFKDQMNPTFTALVNAKVASLADLQALGGSNAMYREIAWQAALAAFLVIHDLSSVVDCAFSRQDNHGQIVPDYLLRFAILACYREVTRHLSEYTVQNSGDTLLDRTGVIFLSDFNRQGVFSWSAEQGGFGTDHDTGTSLLLAGGNFVRGRYFGSVAQGDLLPKDNPFHGRAGGVIPIDPITGAIKPGGSIVTAYTIFPSIMNVFNVPIPLQQITDSAALPFLKKS